MTDTTKDVTKDMVRKVTVNRTYKSRIFEMIFSDKKEFKYAMGVLAARHTL